MVQHIDANAKSAYRSGLSKTPSLASADDGAPASPGSEPLGIGATRTTAQAATQTLGPDAGPKSAQRRDRALAPPPFVNPGDRRPDTKTAVTLYAFAAKALELEIIDQETFDVLSSGNVTRKDAEAIRLVHRDAREARQAAEGSAHEPALFVKQRIAAYLSELSDRQLFEQHAPPVQVKAAILHALLNAEAIHRADEDTIERRLAGL